MELYALLILMIVGICIIIWQFGKYVGQSKNTNKVLDNVKVAKEVETRVNQLSPDAMRDSLRKPDN